MVWIIGRYCSMKGTCDWKAIKYLHWIAKKHNLDTQEFLVSIIRAWANGASRCEKLGIKCIIKAGEHSYFRITDATRLITQTKVNLKLLKDIAGGRIIVTGELKMSGRHKS